MVIETPNHFAKRFFGGDEDALQDVVDWLEEKMPLVNSEIIKTEVKRFINYWSELSKNGKKQRWQLQKTFEVKRRLATWFANLKKFSKTGKII